MAIGTPFSSDICDKCDCRPCRCYENKVNPVVNISDNDIISLWRTARPSLKQNKAMLYEDGVHVIDRPSWELCKYTDLVIKYVLENLKE